MNETTSSEPGASPSGGTRTDHQQTLPPPPGPLRLTRRRDGEIGGVAGGLADYLEIDPVIVRVAFVILAITGGFGLLLYVVLWIALPEADARPSVGESAVRKFGDTPVWVQVLVAVGVALFLVAQIAGGEISLVWAVVLVALGVVLFRQGGDEPAAVHASGPQAATSAGPVTHGAAVHGAAVHGASVHGASVHGTSVHGWSVHGATVHGASVSGGVPAPAPAKPSEPPPPPSALGRVTLAVALLVVGGAAALDNMDLVELATRDYLALGMLIVGLGLVVGAFFGRARWLALVALALLPPLALVGVLQDVRLAGGVGDLRWAPNEPSEVRERYHLLAGAMEVDLTDVDFSQASDPLEVQAGVTFGELIVVVPDDVDVEVTGRLQAGEASVFGERDAGGGMSFGNDEGVALVLDQNSTVADPEGTLELHIASTFGEVTVERESGGR